MKHLFLLFFISLSACAKVSYPKRFVDPQLLPYVEAWENITGKRVNFRVTINNTPRVQIGLCHIANQYDWERLKEVQIAYSIEIQMAYFDKLSNELKQLALEQVINHELEHCVKKRTQHTDLVLTDGCPASIMYPYGFGHTDCYLKHRTYYWNEVRDVN